MAFAPPSYEVNLICILSTMHRTLREGTKAKDIEFIFGRNFVCVYVHLNAWKDFISIKLFFPVILNKFYLKV